MKRTAGAWASFRMQLLFVGTANRLLLPSPLSLPALCAQDGFAYWEGVVVSRTDTGKGTDAERGPETHKCADRQTHTPHTLAHFTQAHVDKHRRPP